MALLSFVLIQLWRLKRVVDRNSSRTEVVQASLFMFLALGVVLAFLVSNNSTDVTRIRYLAPLFMVLACSLGFIFHKMLLLKQPLVRPVALLLLAFVLANNASAVIQRLRSAHVPLPQESLIEWLREKGVDRGYANYWNAYSTVFLSREQIVLDPLKDGYIAPYRALVAGHSKIVYVDTRPAEWGAGPVFNIAGKQYSLLEQKEFETFNAYILETGGSK